MRLLSLVLVASIILSGCASTETTEPVQEAPEAYGVNDAGQHCFGDDIDGDRVTDMCDDDSTDGPLADTDGDGIMNRDDQCPGHDDAIDQDQDGIVDGCDDDPTDGPGADADGDGVKNADDQCQGHDDNVDADNDTIIDGCDDDPTDGPGADADGDGVSNADDVCPGHDDRIDGDGDGVPDGCDELMDSDGDGVSDEDDVCPGADDNYDSEGDGDLLPDCMYKTDSIDGRCLKRTTSRSTGSVSIVFGFDEAYLDGDVPDQCQIHLPTPRTNAIHVSPVCFISESDGPTRHRFGYAEGPVLGPLCPPDADITWSPWVTV